MGNAFAYLALFGFLPFGVVLFSVFRPPIAALVIFLGAFMFLPELTELDLPLVPSLGKQEVAALACMLGMMLRARRRALAARPFRGPDLFILLLFIGNLGTAYTNKDPITHGPTVLPGLTYYEAISLTLFDMLRLFLPFFIGRALFTTVRDLRQLLAGLVLAGVIYTPFLFVELMLSPQLNLWIYGFHQHEFLQTIRGGGYRPMVFMAHGLVVGLFMAWSVMAAVTLVKARKSTLGLPSPVLGLYDFGFLVACKSLGALIYALVMTPVISLLRPRAGVRVCTLLAVMVLTYPMLRAAGLFPEKALVAMASNVSTRASQSIQFRFGMETMLSDRAAERPLFGWGRFRRSMIFDEYTGHDISVSDGQWIIAYGMRGVWGFLCFFGLLVSPIFYLRRRLRFVGPHDERTMLTGLACILTVGLVDLLPNALQNTITVFFAGALWGLTRGLSSARAPESIMPGFAGPEPTASESTSESTPPASPGEVR